VSAAEQLEREQGITHDATDLRNAERFVEMHGAIVRYVHAWAKWLTWDDSRWVVDDTGSALRLAADTAKVMLAEALAELNAAQKAFADAKTSGDDEGADTAERRMKRAKQLFGHAIKTQNASKLHAILDLARADARIAIRHQELDADPWLFNVANGTIDLRTGKLRRHDPADLITKLAPVEYAPEAKCPTWDAFLSQAQGGNDEMLAFLHRARGYLLTGLTIEHVLFFLFGPTGTGKSTYFVVLHALLGDYAVRAPRGLLFVAKGDRHTTDLTTLFGARFVSCSEIEEGATFDEALVKDLTGGEAVTARRMREDNWTFEPTHKIALPGNHKPNVRNFDDAIRRRVRLIPWVVQPAAPDRALVSKLKAELPGILADAVRGCLEWQREGLGEPVAVRDATDAYQDESDVLGEFCRLYVKFGETAANEAPATVARKTLRAVYEAYCEENGLTPVGAKKFAAKLRANGVTGTSVRLPSGKPADGWRGIRLLTDAERAAAGAWSRTDVVTSNGQLQHQPYTGNSAVGINRDLPTTGHYSVQPDDDGEPYYDPNGHAFHDLLKG